MARPRLTIGRLMIFVAGVAVVLWLSRMMTQGGVVLVAIGLLMGCSTMLVPPRPRVAFWSVIVSSTLVSPLVGLIVAEGPELGSVGLCYVLLFVISPFTIGCLAAWTVANLHSPPACRSRQGQIVVTLLAILPWTMVLGQWPLHLAFLISRPALDRLADRVVAGQPISFPVQAGFYRIEAVRYNSSQGGNVALITDDDPNGRSGFVRLTDGALIDFDLMTNLNDNFRLDSTWRYQDED